MMMMEMLDRISQKFRLVNMVNQTQHFITKIDLSETSVQNETKNDHILKDTSGYQIPISERLNKG